MDENRCERTNKQPQSEVEAPRSTPQTQQLKIESILHPPRLYYLLYEHVSI